MNALTYLLLVLNQNCLELYTWWKWAVGLFWPPFCGDSAKQVYIDTFIWCLVGNPALPLQRPFLRTQTDLDSRSPVPTFRSKGSRRDPKFPCQGSTRFCPHSLVLPKHTETQNFTIFNGALYQLYSCFCSTSGNSCSVSHVILWSLWK